MNKYQLKAEIETFLFLYSKGNHTKSEIADQILSKVDEYVGGIISDPKDLENIKSMGELETALKGNIAGVNNFKIGYNQAISEMRERAKLDNPQNKDNK